MTRAFLDHTNEDFQNILEATIQEQYTSIHPAVKWRFYDAAEKYQYKLSEQIEDPMIEDIVFDEVYPLFGQSDIKGSSLARNEAIIEDLTTQLQLAIKILEAALQQDNLPIYEELIFRVETYLQETQEGLKAGDELGILQFFKKDIHPVFAVSCDANASRRESSVQCAADTPSAEAGALRTRR